MGTHEILVHLRNLMQGFGNMSSSVSCKDIHIFQGSSFSYRKWNNNMAVRVT